MWPCSTLAYERVQIKQHQRGVRGHSIPEGSALWLGAMNRSLSPPPPTPVLHFHFYTNTENTQTVRTENLSTSTLYRLIYTVMLSTSWCVFPTWQGARCVIVIFNQKITSSHSVATFLLFSDDVFAGARAEQHVCPIEWCRYIKMRKWAFEHFRFHRSEVNGYFEWDFG